MTDRKMAELVTVDDVLPHPNADLLEICKIRGWYVVSKIGDFKKGDTAAYFSIDSWIPNNVAPFLSKGKEPREFNGVKGERIRTIKLRGHISQGLLLPVEYKYGGYINVGGVKFRQFEQDIQDALNIQKYEPPIPVNMAGEIRCHYPTDLSPKTDQERIQNLVDEFVSFTGKTFEVTEKLDGSSASYIICDNDYHVCSRNLSLKENDTNVFWRIEKKYNILEKIRNTGRNLCVQGELIGPKIQDNKYKLKELDFYVYNVYDIDTKRFLMPHERMNIADELGLKHVPLLEIFEFNFENVDDVLDYADGKSKINENTKREGLVFKCTNTNNDLQFKAISNAWLLKNE